MFIKSCFLSPVGYITIISVDKTLIELEITDKMPDYTFKNNSFNDYVIEQLKEYFNNKRTDFDIKIGFSTGTDFQKAVWNTLKSISLGTTVSYSEICNIIGCPKAFRAVGSAVGKNPIPIILPCHRVIKSNGHIGNFAYGEGIKKFLLKLEK